MDIENIINGRIAFIACILLFFAGISLGTLHAEGIQDAAPTATDVVWLNVNSPSFGSFAAYGSANSTSGVAINLKPGECIYLGLSAGSTSTTQTNFNQAYNFRLVNSAGAVVHGPFNVSSANQNVGNWNQAGGPSELGVAGGYNVTATSGGDLIYKFCPAAAGEYWIEFDTGNRLYIPLWDFTVGDPIAGVVEDGRVYSQNWSFRTPPDGLPQGIYCNAFQRPFNGTLFSYTSDGFVSQIDFANSGLRGLTFNVAFDSDGPGTTGTLADMRKSIENVNATGNSAEHKIFLSPPDPVCFPDGECGEITVINLTCEPGGYCINFNITQAGTVETFLDFNSNGEYDVNSADVLFVENFAAPGNQCLLWNGVKGDGTTFMAGENVSAVFQFTQGVQHYAAYDVEYLTEGFCVETVRPAGCPSNTKLYYDDTDINSTPGTGQPLDGTGGCDCQTAGCRTWDNFVSCLGGTSPGYGNFNTMNTWWFAYVAEEQIVSLQVADCVIDGNDEICVGEELLIEVETEPGITYTYSWEDPNGGMTASANYTVASATLADAGEYCVTVTTGDGCETSCCLTVVVNDLPTCSIGAEVPASSPTGTDAEFTVTFMDGVAPYAYNVLDAASASVAAGNVAAAGGTANITGLEAGVYSLEVTDLNGCTNTCDIELLFADVAIEKTITTSATPTGNLNEFNLIYSVSITNNGTGVGTYDVSDTLKYGAGAVVVSAMASYVGGGSETNSGTDLTGTYNGVSSYLLSDDENIAAGATEEWSVSVVFTVDTETVTTTSGDCTLTSSESGTGLLNCAAVSGGVPDMVADICEPIPMPAVEITKTISSSASPTGNLNEFSIENTITVSNTGDAKAFYTLTDTLKYGAGATILSSTAAYIGGGTETNSGTDNTGSFDGVSDFVLSTNEMIEVGATEEWTVTTIFTVDPTVVTTTSGDCTLDSGEAGTGLLNCAAVSGGVPDNVADVCEPIPMPAVEITKTISSSAAPTGNLNEFSISYIISITNAGDAKAFYDLTDTLKYGLGTTVVSATASYVGGGTETFSGTNNTGNYDGQTDFLITDDEMIEVGSTEDWMVDVVFTVDPEIVTGLSSNCVLETGETGTGLLNCAAVSDGVPNNTDDACEPIPMLGVSISKTINNSVTPTANPNEFSISYLITITNTGDAKAFYDLTDTLKFGAGSTIISSVASYVGGGSETFSGIDNTTNFDGESDFLISDNEMIEIGAAEDWMVDVVFVVDPEMVTGTSSNCILESGESVTGLLNCAAVSDGVPDDADDACAPIPMPAVSISKTINSSVSPTGNPNEFAISYLITITNTGDSKAYYDLSDTLKFGLGTNVLSANASYIGGGTETFSGTNNTGNFDGETDFLISDDEMIEIGASEDWMVDVVLTVDPQAVTGTSSNCVLETGETVTGLLNCAAVSDGVPDDTDDACEPIPMPAVNISKTIFNSSIATGNPNEFTISYLITISNSGDAKAFYDLSDTLKFGAGTSIVSSIVSYVGGGTETFSGIDNTASFDGQTAFLISDDEMIEVGAFEDWMVDVTYTIMPATVTIMSADCVLDAGESGTGLLNCAAVSDGVPDDTDDVCEPIAMPAVSLSKTIANSSTPTGNLNEFSIEYNIAVSNTGDAISFYDLSDTLKFGAGASIVNVIASYLGGGTEINSGIDNTANFDGTTIFLLSDDETIEVGATENWSIVVVYTIDLATMTETSSDCDLVSGETGTGLLNCAAVSDGVPDQTDDVCEPMPIPSVNISKTISSTATPTGNPNEFSIEYTISIENTGDAKAFYDLTDTLKYGSGATIVNTTATYIGGGTETNSGIDNTANFDGTSDFLLSDDEMIEIGAFEEWTVITVFTVDVEMITETSADCSVTTGETGTGLSNCAAVSDGVPDATDDICEPIPVPSVSISKTISSSATPTGNPNEFEIEYTITVTSTGSAKAFYDLTDTLKYGAGASIVSATAAYIGGGSETNSGTDLTGTFDGVGNYLLTDDEMIEIGAVEEWTVTTVFTIDTEMITDMSSDCSLDSGETGTGLLNCVAVSDGVPDATDDICEPLPVPAVDISKAITNSATPTGNPNEFSIEYTITVSSIGSAKAFYTLTDTLKYGAGATVVSSTAAYVGGGIETNSGIDNTPSFDGVADFVLSTDEMIEVGAIEEWTVTTVFTVDPLSATSTSADCTVDPGEAGTGLLNCASVSGSVPDDVADICEPIPLPAVDIAKAVTSPATPTGNPNEFEIEYTITVTSTGDAKAFYDLTDTLKYGAGSTIVGTVAAYIGGGTETNSGTDLTGTFDGVGNYLLTDDEMIEVGAVEEWTVTTTFTIDPTVVTTTSGDCNLDAGETGTGLLNCAAVSDGVPDEAVDVCVPLPMPAVDIAKAITSSATPTGNPNEFEIEYTITVTSTGDAKAFYDLTDTLKYGAGATIVGTVAAYVGGGTETNSGTDLTGIFDGVGNYLLTDDEMIEVGAVEEWTVTTIFTVDPTVTTIMSADCTLDAGEAGTGLLNCAAVSDGVPDETDDVCETIPMPAVEILKTISNPTTWTGNPFEYSISYNVQISNVGDALAFYDLTDTLKFGAGANIVSATASYLGGGMETNSGIDNTANFDGTTDYLISDGETIDVGGIENWEITVVFTVDIAQITEDSEDCDLAAGESGTGLLNCAAVSDGVPDDSDDACEPIPPVPGIDLVKDIADIQTAASGTIGNVDLTIDFQITNIGNTDIMNISLVDDIVAEFGSAFVEVIGIPVLAPGTATMLPTINPAYTGMTPALNMFLGTDGFLMRAEQFQITIIVEVDPNAPGAPDPLENQAVASGTPIDENGDPVNDPVTGDPEVTDESDSGTEPDDVNLGEPGDEGTTDDPTEIRVPLISAVKSLIDYLPANSGEEGHLDIVMEIGVKNIGNVALDNITLMDDMTTAIPGGFGALFESIVYDGTYPNITSNTTAGIPGGLNPAFDGGIADAEIFDGTGILAVNEEIYVQIRIELDLSSDVGVAIPDTLFNLATATGDYTDPNSGETTTVDDDTDSGADFESTNPDEPGDTGSPDDPTPVPLLSCIGNMVWNDCNGNGLMDAGEEGIAGVSIFLKDDTGAIVMSTITDSDGKYNFDFIFPGDYYLDFDTPLGYDFTFPDSGTDDELDSDVTGFYGAGTTNLISIQPGMQCEENDFYDAGMYQCVLIGDNVWYDADEDNIWDNIENGINGLTVNLYRKNNDTGVFELYNITQTGHKPGTPSDDGWFKFCAAPGTYYVEIGTPLNGLVLAQPDVGNDEEVDSDLDNYFGPNTSDEFTVICGQPKCDLGAGFYLMATAGDIVWRDDNANGKRESFEPRVSGVNVKAFDNTGTQISEDITDNNGHYFIDYLQEEDYFFKITPPSGFGVTQPNAGNDESVDSDVTNSNGPGTTDFYTMESGEHAPNIDMGLVEGVLPVTYLLFAGVNEGAYNAIKWATDNEVSNSHFELERKFQDNAFVKIARIEGGGTTSARSDYRFDDYDIKEPGVYYYRLKQLDHNGNFDKSGIIAIVIKDENAVVELALFPNPVIDDLNLEIINVDQVEDIVIEIFAADGKLVKIARVVPEQGEVVRNHNINVENLVPGVYNISIRMDNLTIQKQFIKLD